MIVDYKLINLDPTQETEVRIYQISADGSMVPADETFTKIGDNGTGVGVRLEKGYGVDFTGALPYAGVLDLDAIDPAVSSINTEAGVVTFENQSEIPEKLRTAAGFTVTEIPDYAGQ